MHFGWIIVIVCCTGLLIASIGGLLYNVYKNKFQRKEEFKMNSKDNSTETTLRIRRFFPRRSSADNHKLEKGMNMEYF
jgi:hypothetical protein